MTEKRISIAAIVLALAIGGPYNVWVWREALRPVPANRADCGDGLKQHGEQCSETILIGQGRWKVAQVRQRGE